MALEGLAAFSLAGNILQCIDSSSKIVSKFKEIYRSTSGTTKDAEDLTALHRHLEEVCSQLCVGDSDSPQNANSLSNLAKKCEQCTKELLEMLSKIQSGRSGSKWDSARAAFKAVWTSGDIEAMQRKIGGYRNELILHLQAVHKYDFQSSINSREAN
jgi:hypothetical protein